MKAILAAVKAAGGSVEGEPIRVGDAGMLVVFVADPAGNRLELVEQTKAGRGF